jgi:hypothetical protein
MRTFIYLALALQFIFHSFSGPAGPTVVLAHSPVAVDELAGLLPPSDLVASLDVQRMFNEIIPKSGEITAGGVDRLTKGLTEFKNRTGIDPAKVQGAVLGARLDSLEAPAVIVLQGVDVDAKQVEAAAAAYKAEFKTSEYKGRTLYGLILKTGAPSIGPVSLKIDALTLVSLGNQRIALGDLSLVKTVIDNQAGGPKTGISPEIGKALSETRSTALIRFAANLPASVRSQLSDQGDLFNSIAGIKMMLGTIDAAPDLSLSLDMNMRTASQASASELENSLKGLLVLVKGIFGTGGGDGKNDWIGQLLDRVAITSKASDVLLGLAVPRSVLDQLSKKPVTAEKK